MAYSLNGYQPRYVSVLAQLRKIDRLLSCDEIEIWAQKLYREQEGLEPLHSPPKGGTAVSHISRKSLPYGAMKIPISANFEDE